MYTCMHIYIYIFVFQIEMYICVFIYSIIYIRVLHGALACGEGEALSRAIRIVVLPTGCLDLESTICSQRLGSFGDGDGDSCW